jgi:cytochrome d ubiquinol oxidase subunit II
MAGLEVCAGLALLAALIAYGLSGGADFGGGVWDLLARGPRAARQRAQVAHSIGPIWEANHVWLILAIVVLATAFPPAFARIATVLHVPLLLMLLGIVARGAAFSIRAYGDPAAAEAGEVRANGWGRVFALASLVTPLLLGMIVGAIAAGRVRPPTSTADYFLSWLSPFAFAVGLFALLLFAFLAAVYLAHDARYAGEENEGPGTSEERKEKGPGLGPHEANGRDDARAAGFELSDRASAESFEVRGGHDDSGATSFELSDDFRRRALAAGLLLAPIAAGVLALAARHAPQILHGLTRTPWSWCLHLATATCALTALGALLARRLRLARAAAAAQAVLILAGWALAQYPYLVPPDLTLATAAAPASTLRFLLGALAAGAAVLLPSLLYLYRLFGRVRIKRN